MELLRVGSIPIVSTDLPFPCRISNILTPGQHPLKQTCFYGPARGLEWRLFVRARCAMDPRQRALDFQTATGLRVLEEVDGKPVPRYSGWIVHDLRRSAVKNLSKAGVNEPVAMASGGRKTRPIFRRYRIVDVADARLYVTYLYSATPG